MFYFTFRLFRSHNSDKCFTGPQLRGTTIRIRHLQCWMVAAILLPPSGCLSWSMWQPPLVPGHVSGKSSRGNHNLKKQVYW